MSLMCGCDSDDYVEIPISLETSLGTEFCHECGRLISFGEKHYRVRLWTFSDSGEESERGIFVTCESCGDLAASVLELGYCWEFGSLRDDVRELAAYDRKPEKIESAGIGPEA